MKYIYKMIQVPPTIDVKQKEHRGNEAAVYMESIVNSIAKEGWEFYRVDTIGVQVSPGCIASLFGQKMMYTNYHVITFRKEA